MIPSASSLLFLDASAATPTCGVWKSGQWVAFARAEAPPLESLWPLVAQTLQAASLSLEQIEGFIFCEGPGSVLGIRLAAMFIRTVKALPEHAHKPVYGFNGLLAAEAILCAREKASPPYAVLTESRMNRWNVLLRTSGASEPELKEIAHSSLGELPQTRFHLRQRSDTLAPEGSSPLPSAFDDYAALLTDAVWLYPVEKPEAKLLDTPDYQRWNQQRHRAH